MTSMTKSLIDARVLHAKNKHPNWAGQGKYWALGIVLAEVDEFIHAVEHESAERQKDEALDVIATCVRFVQEEYK